MNQKIVVYSSKAKQIESFSTVAVESPGINPAYVNFLFPFKSYIFAALGDGSILILDVNLKKEVTRLIGHAAAVASLVVWEANGLIRMISVGNDLSLIVWYLNSILIGKSSSNADFVQQADLRQNLKAYSEYYHMDFMISQHALHSKPNSVQVLFFGPREETHVFVADSSNCLSRFIL